ncbi:MAG: S-methyl thiohydantoin desulfurase domain-containing protein [Methylobacter sp.]
MFNDISIEKSSLNENKQLKQIGISGHKIKNFGPGNYQLIKKDINYIVHGACFLGSGGGASIGLTLLFMDKMISNTDIMTYVNPDALEANKNISFVALLGSPDKMFEGFGETAALNAFLEMNNYLTYSGREPLGYLLPVEMGAINSLIPFIISARKGIAIINGDPCGRAAPEMGMNLFNTNKLPINPVILTSDTDDSEHYQKQIVQVKDADDAEIQARQFARLNNNVAGMACYPMQGADLNCSTSDKNRAKFIQWTIGLAWNLGRNIVESKNYNEFIRLLNSFPLSSHILFEGIITNKEERKISGFDAGKITVSNSDQTIFIYYKNESLLAWNVTKKCYMAMGPDSINFLSEKDAQPFTNADINSDPEKNPKNIPLGTAIGVIGLCAFEKLQNAELVDLFLSNIQETLAAFPEDHVPIPGSYISLPDLISRYKSEEIATTEHSGSPSS